MSDEKMVVVQGQKVFVSQATRDQMTENKFDGRGLPAGYEIVVLPDEELLEKAKSAREAAGVRPKGLMVPKSVGMPVKHVGAREAARRRRQMETRAARRHWGADV